MVERKLLTLDEAAELLGVDYKTVYRLVRSGAIPAGRVGRVYRIEPADLTAYFEAQKRRHQETARPAGGEAVAAAFTCGGCGRAYLSELSQGGACAVCGEPLCLDCWTALNRRRCTTHSEDAAPASEASATAPACGRCGQALTRDWQTAGRCAEPNCGAPLCRRCWGQEDDRYCERHSAGGSARMERLEHLRQAGAPVVEAPQARATEAAFLQRVDEAVAALDEVVDPVSGQAAPWGACEVTRTPDDQLAEVRRLLGGQTAADAIRSAYPLAAGVRYEVKARRKAAGVWLVIEARSCVRLEAHAKQGFDHQPMTLAELNAAAAATVREAETSGRPAILILASPTGWAKDAVKHAAGGGRRAFRHRLVSVVLWDLYADQAHLPPDDLKLDGYLGLVAPEALEQAYQEAADYVEKRLARRETVPAAEVAERLHLGPRTVRHLFERLGREHDYLVARGGDIGTVISRR